MKCLVLVLFLLANVVSAGEPKSRAAWELTDRLLKSFSLEGTWFLSTPKRIESGTLHWHCDREKFFVKMICTVSEPNESQDAGTWLPSDSRVGAVLLMLDDGNTFAVNKKGPLVKDSDCFLRVLERTRENYRLHSDFVREHLSSLAMLLNPNAMRENFGVAHEQGDGFVTKLSFNKIYERRNKFSESSGFNVESSELYHLQDEVVDARTEVFWKNEDGNWIPVSFTSTNGRPGGEQYIHGMTFDRLDLEPDPSELQFQFALLEPCEGTAMVDKREQGQTPVYRIPEVTADDDIEEVIEYKKAETIAQRGGGRSYLKYFLLAFGGLSVVAGLALWRRKN